MMARSERRWWRDFYFISLLNSDGTLFCVLLRWELISSDTDPEDSCCSATGASVADGWGIGELSVDEFGFLSASVSRMWWGKAEKGVSTVESVGLAAEA